MGNSSSFQNTQELELEKQGIQEEINVKKSWSFWEGFFFWIGILLLLAFLGFNIFKYLGDLLDFLKKLIAPLLKVFGISTIETTKQTLATSTTGSKSLLDMISSSARSGLDDLEKKLLPDKSSNKVKVQDQVTKTDTTINTDKQDKQDKQEKQDTQEKQDKQDKQDTQEKKDKQDKEDNLYKNQKVPQAFPKPKSDREKSDGETESEPIGASRMIATPSKKEGVLGKGWCYVGTDQGVRSCIKVDMKTTCQSGKIYDSEYLCQEPNLR